MKVTACVLIADGAPDSEGDSVIPDEVHFENEIPVKLNPKYCSDYIFRKVGDKYKSFSTNEKKIGTANLKFTEDRLYAEMEMDDSVDIIGKYPAICGCVDPESLGGKLKNVRITMIGLYDDPNQDGRIECIT